MDLSAGLARVALLKGQGALKFYLFLVFALQKLFTLANELDIWTAVLHKSSLNTSHNYIQNAHSAF